MNKLIYSVVFLLTSAVSFAAGTPMESAKAEAERHAPEFMDSLAQSVRQGIVVPQAVAAYAIPRERTHFRPVTSVPKYFNGYVLKAVDYLYKNYRLRGYDIHSALTHDISYYKYGKIAAINAPQTMCVAAQLEVMLTAMDIYAHETGDYGLYDYLPKESYEGLDANDIRGHVWVNHAFDSWGTADALIHFGMGERVAFDQLRPGAFININRTNGTGHAVTFLGYIDAKGAMVQTYNPSTVVGFKYFSSQGKATAGEGGFDFRYAIFAKYGCPNMPYKRDCGVMLSADQRFLNTGNMLSPRYWKHPSVSKSYINVPPTVFNGKYFNGVTTDD